MGTSSIGITAGHVIDIIHATRGQVPGLPPQEQPVGTPEERGCIEEGELFSDHAVLISTGSDEVLIEGTREQVSALLGRALVRLHHDRLTDKSDAVSKLIWRIASDEDALVDLLVFAAETGGMLACKPQWAREDNYATAEELNMLISPLALEVLNRDEAMAAFDLEPDEVEPHLPPACC